MTIENAYPTKTIGSKIFSRAIRLALIVSPVAYFGNLFSTIVHEVLGHSLTAILLGGRVDGIEIHWDGFGWAAAYLPDDASDLHQLFLSISGIIATTLIGALLLPLVFIRNLNLHIRLTLLVLAGCCLLEGPPYAFWNGVHPVPPGDIHYVLAYGERLFGLKVWVLRYSLILVGAGMTIGVTVLLISSFFGMVQTYLSPDHPFSFRGKLGVMFVFIILPMSGGWLMLDWDQLAPGLGRLPGIFGSFLSIFAAGGILLRASRSPRD